jgi:WD40 repeat protein
VKGGPQTWDVEKPVGVIRACLSHDGAHIAAVFDDGTLCIYDTTGKPILPRFKVDKYPLSVIFSRDGKFVATGGQSLQLWNVQTGEEVESFNIKVRSLALSPDGACIAAGCVGREVNNDDEDGSDNENEDGSDNENEVGSYNIRVINLELAKISHRKDGAHPYEPPGGGGIKLLKGEAWPSPFEGHKGDVWSVTYSPDGKQIASGSIDGTVRVWDVSTGERRTFKENFGWTRSVAFSPDGTQIAADDKLINLSTGSFTRLGDKFVMSWAFSADGRFIASGTYSPSACQIWDASTHQSIVQLILVGHTDDVHSVAFFPDGKQIMSASNDGTIRVWDVELLEERGEMDGWQVKRGNEDRICGAEGEYLFWTQLPFRHTRNTLVIGECLNIDFSNFVHGDEWVKCQEPL